MGSRRVRWHVVIAEASGERRMYGSAYETLLELAVVLDWMFPIGGSARVVLIAAVCRPPARRRK
jgi:hypothetical protein